MPGSIELHLLCHVTLLYCQVDPNPKPKAKSKAKKSLLPLPILPLMWQPLARLNHCYSSNSLPFLPCGLGLKEKNKEKENFSKAKCHGGGSCGTSAAPVWLPPHCKPMCSVTNTYLLTPHYLSFFVKTIRGL